MIDKKQVVFSAESEFSGAVVQSDENKAPEEFAAMSAQDVELWRQQHPQPNVWGVVLSQGFVGLVGTVFLYFFQLMFGQSGWAVSGLYGVFVVVIPGAICVRGLNSKFGRGSLGISVAKFFVWEFVKVALSVTMLFSASKMIGESLSWPSLLIGMVLAFKGFWGFVVWRSYSTNKAP